MRAVRFSLPCALGTLLLLSACQADERSAAAAVAPAPTPSPATQAAPAEAGLHISDAWLRAPMPNAPATGGFFTLHNGNLEADKLTAARSDAAERVEIHETRIEDGISKMRHLPEGVTIAAGQQVAFAPGGLHLMLMAPTRSLAVGEKVELTLTFANAPEQTVIFEVRDATAMPANHLGDHGAEGVDSHAH